MFQSCSGIFWSFGQYPSLLQCMQMERNCINAKVFCSSENAILQARKLGVRFFVHLGLQSEGSITRGPLHPCTPRKHNKPKTIKKLNLLRSIARPPYSKAPDVWVGSVRNRSSRRSGSKSFFLQAQVWERKLPDIHVPASRINLQQSSLDSCWMSVAASSSNGLVVVAARAVPSPPLLPPFSIILFSKPPRDAAAPLQELLSIPTITVSVSRLLVSPNPMKSFVISPLSLMSLSFFIKASSSFSSQSHEEKKGETKPPWPQKNRIRFTTDDVKASWDKYDPLSLHRKFLQNQWTARDFRRLLLCCSLAHLAVQSLAHAKTLGEYRKAKDTKTTEERPDWSIAHYCKL